MLAKALQSLKRYLGAKPVPTPADLQKQLHIEARKVLRENIRGRQTKLDSLPLGVNISFTGRGCNISCSMCAFPSVVDKRAFGDFYRRVSESLRPHLGKFSLIQSAGAEPLMYPEFRELVEEGKQWPRLQFSIGTNGVLIDEAWAKSLCHANVSKLSVSLDAATEETYRLIRRKSDWSRVMDGLRSIRRHRRGERPVILMNFVVLRDNYKEMESFVDLAAEVGAQEVIFQTPLRVSDHRAIVNGERDKLTKLEWTYRAETFRDPQIAAEVLWQLSRAREKADRLGIRIPYTNVGSYFLDRHPYLAGVESVDRIEDVSAFVAEASGGQRAEWAGIAPVKINSEFGTDPEVLEWQGEEDYEELVAWFVNLDQRIPDAKSVMRIDIQGCESRLRLDDERLAGRLANGSYDVFIVAEKDGDYSVSERGRLVVTNDPDAIWLGEPSSTPPSFTLDDYEDRPERVEGSGSDFFCTHPFTNMTIRDGTFSFCCWAQPKYHRMPAADGDVEKMWNSRPIREARYHMLTGEGREKVCSNICPYYESGFHVADVGGDGFET